MHASQAASLLKSLVEHGVDCCVAGGWGVDALVGTATRGHKDLDVLLPETALPDALTLWATEGFVLEHLWAESRGIAGQHPLVGEPIPSAFVLTHGDGREIDAVGLKSSGRRRAVRMRAREGAASGSRVDGAGGPSNGGLVM